MASMIITHDLGIVAHYCDEVAVMFAGEIIEQGKYVTSFSNPPIPILNNYWPQPQNNCIWEQKST